MMTNLIHELDCPFDNLQKRYFKPQTHDRWTITGFYDNLKYCKKVDPRMNDQFSRYFLGISLDNEAIREKVR